MLLKITRFMTTSIIAKDILFFLPSSVLSGRENNDKNNKIREEILPILIKPDPRFINDTEYGPIWSDMSTKLNNTIHNITPQVASLSRDNHTFHLEHKGGLTYNHDFMFYCFHNDNPDNSILSIPIEFKYNATSIIKLAQFLELSDKSMFDDNKFNMSSYSYSEFYYDHYLQKYIDIINTHLDHDISRVSLPEKTHYLKHIQNFKTTDPFFLLIKSLASQQKDLKSSLVTQSYTEYLQLHSHSFTFDKLTEKIRSSQKEKIYIMWDNQDFNIEQMNVDNLTLSHILPDSINGACFTIETINFQHNIRVRINWGNINGVLNPRWKISLINK